MLQINHITKIFDRGTTSEKYALNDVTINIQEKDFVTIIGGNGAGKSTMLNAISGVFPVDGGSITISGHDVTNTTEFGRAKYMGRVFQDPRMGTATNMSIEENMALAYRRGKRRSIFRWGITHSEREIFGERLKQLGLGLEDRMKAKAGLLSGGQRQALTLLMATFNRPNILLLDEHTAALDPKTAQIVLELTVKIVTEEKLTALMVTHNMKDALRIGNRISMMHEGHCILDIGQDKKKNLTVTDLMEMFGKASGEDMANDRMLLG